MASDRLQYLFDLLQGKDELSPGLAKSDKRAKGLNKSLKNLGRPLKSAGAPVLKMGAAFTAAATAAASIGTALVGAKIIRLANEQEDAVNSLNIALKASGRFTDKASKDFQDFASSLQQASRFGDEAILQNAALIQSLGQLDQNGLKRATQASIDLSSALGIDLTAAATLVGKAAAGEVGSFSRYGLVIKKGADNAETFTRALSGIEQKFGGAALGKINTFSGATQQASNSFGDLLEEFGFLITKNPAVISAVNTAAKGFTDLIKVVNDNKEALTRLASDGIIMIIESVGFMVGSFFDFIEIVSKATVAIKKFFDTSTNDARRAAEENARALIESGNAVTDAQKQQALDQIKILEDLQKKEDDARELSLANRLKSIKELRDKISNLTSDITKVVSGSVDVKVSTSGSGQRKSKQSFSQILSDGFKQVAETKVFGKSLIDSVGAVAQGGAGARKLFSGLAAGAADTFLPGLGKAVGPIVDLLAQGPDQVRKTVREFTQAIPDIIQAIIESLPVLVEELVVGLADAVVAIADKADIIVERFILALVRAAPRIITSLIFLMPRLVFALSKAMPRVALAFAEAMVKEVPNIVGAIIDGLAKGLKDLFKDVAGPLGDVFGGSGGISGSLVGSVVGGPVGAVLGGFGFAKGGEVPTGFNNDTFPARLSSGEGIIRSDLNPKLKQFLDNPSGLNDALLGQILSMLNTPIMVESRVELNNKAFADIILEMSRTNQRVV